jgi:hypothetical protein
MFHFGKNLSARLETGDAEMPKFERNLICVVIPSQAWPESAVKV